MRRLLLILLLLVALLGIALALVPLLVDKEAIIGLATKTLRDETGAELVIAGDSEFSLFPMPGFSLSEVAITAAGKQEPGLRAESVKVGMQLLPLILGRMEIDTIRLDGLVVRVEPPEPQAGKNNPHTDIASDAGTALAIPLALRVQRFLITNARLEEIGAANTNTLELVELQADNLNLEQAPITIAMQLRRAGKKPLDIILGGAIRIDQHSQQIALDDIAVVLSGATAHPVNAQIDGTVTLEPQVADLQLTLESQEMRGEGSLHYSVQASLDGRSDTAVLTTSGNLNHLDIASALAEMEEEPVLSGTASLHWRLEGRGDTTDELTASLSGPLTLTTDNVVLLGTSVERLLCEAVALTNKEQLTTVFPADSRFETLTADINLVQGKARLDPLVANLPQITLTGSGHFDLSKQDFNATFKARLAPELEQLDHACRVSKRLLAIDWPVNCKGRLGEDSRKWCKVDTGKILQDLTLNEGKDKLEKKASKWLNKLFNQDN